MVRQRSRPEPDNQSAMQAEVMRTMGVVGIGRRYHDERFSHFKGGEGLKRLLLCVWTAENIAEGKGITIVGSDDIAGHLHMMLARSLHLAGANVLVVGLEQLSRMLQRTEDEFEELDIEKVGALFIRKFVDARKCPLRQYEVALVEECLDRRFNDNRSVFPWFAGGTPDDWWSPITLGQLSEPRNVEFPE